MLDIHLNDEDISISSTGSQVYVSAPLGSKLVSKYGELYSRTRLRTLDSLDALPELSEAGELKNKLLFSVVVLAFRSVKQTMAATRQQIRRTLQVTENVINLLKEDFYSFIAVSWDKGVFISKKKNIITSFNRHSNVLKPCCKIV